MEVLFPGILGGSGKVLLSVCWSAAKIAQPAAASQRWVLRSLRSPRDKESRVRQRRVLSALAFSFLVALSPLAADPIIQRGIDAFVTRDDGKTFYDFAHNPIPAGFFCDSPKAFTGRVFLKGLPL